MTAITALIRIFAAETVNATEPDIHVLLRMNARFQSHARATEHVILLIKKILLNAHTNSQMSNAQTMYALAANASIIFRQGTA
jgi:hypothetical protein